MPIPPSAGPSALSPAIFLDRDGVIIHNRVGYVRAWEDVRIYPQALPALRKLAGSPFKIMIISNQSAIQRGLTTRAAVEGINAKLQDFILKNGGRVDGIYICPHAPWENCTCRKPKPGLLLQAAFEQKLDLGNSIMIGDALSDLQAGQNAGIQRFFLVLTGRGRKQIQLPMVKAMGNFQAERNLLAVASILETEGWFKEKQV